MSDPNPNLPATTEAAKSLPATPVTALAAQPAPQLLGQGLALEAVSHAAAMAVQDAGTYFRQVAAVSAAGVAVCTEKLVQTKDPTWAELIAKLNASVQAASGTLGKVGTDAASVVKSFSSGAVAG